MNRSLLNQFCCLVMAALAVSWCGCKPKSDAASPSPEAVEPASSPVSPPATRPPATPPPSAVVVPVNDSSAMLGALTLALRKYSAEKQRVPASLSELAAAGYVSTLPPPPAGKKFVIDRKRLAVELANQ